MGLKPAATLVFSWGNPSRGDDAIGPALHERLCRNPLPGVDLLTDFQLQIEHTVDLRQRQRVVFADAGMDCPAPFELLPLRPARDDSYTSHAMSPSALLALYQEVEAEPPPAAYLLTIRGYRFDLGTPIFPQAAENLAQAETYLKRLLKEPALFPPPTGQPL